MLKFILHRLFWGIPVLWSVATVTFIIMHIVPGGPFDAEKQLPPEIKANIEEKYHLDKPLHTQYLLYIGGLLRGDLGPSYKYLGRSVNNVIADTFPVSIKLGLIAFLISIFTGAVTGILSATAKDNAPWLDKTSMLAAIGGVSIPHFVLAALLILIFSQTFYILPTGPLGGMEIYHTAGAVTCSSTFCLYRKTDALDPSRCP